MKQLDLSTPAGAVAATEYEAPELVVIGDAKEVVLGMPFNGFDHYGYSEQAFEFEADEEDC